jgi:adenosylcobinamide-GDP ribazoletransferase
LYSSLVTAFRTLTAIPIPGREAGDRTASLIWFPVVGAILGVLLFGVCLLAELGASYWCITPWPAATAFAVVFLGAILTRGLHLDGLADTVDGLLSKKDRAGILRIMKDTQIGTFGVVVLFGVLAGKWIAVIRLLESGTALVVVVAYVVSRTVQVELAVTCAYAREEGGTGASFVRGAQTRHRLGAWLLALLLLAPFGPVGLAAIIAGFVLSKLLGGFFKRRIGGITGDLLGASSEVVETLVLVLLAVPGSGLPLLVTAAVGLT